MDLRDKLQLREGMTIALVGAPQTFDLVGVERVRAERADGLLGFARGSGDLPAPSAVVAAARQDRLPGSHLRKRAA